MTKTTPTKLCLLFFIGVTLLLLFPQAVFSLGVAPSFYNLNADASTQTLKLRILNSHHEDMYVQLTPQGDLAPYVTLADDMYHLDPEEESKIIYYTLFIPEDLPAGPNDLRMVLTQLPDGYVEGDTSIEAQISVIQKVTIHVPYPSAYLTGSLFVEAGNTNEAIRFTTHVLSRGDKDVQATGLLRIRGPTNEILDTIQLPPSVIASQKDKRLVVTHPGLEYPGYYVAESIVRYADKEFVTQKTFSVGSIDVKATGIQVDRFRLGEIVKLGVGIQNQWNSRIENLYADVSVLNEQGSEVSTFRTSTTALDAYESTYLDAYWDTARIQAGMYDVAVELNYEERVVETFFKAAVGVDSLAVHEYGLAGKVIADEKEQKEKSQILSTLNLVLLFVIILVVVNVVLVVKFRGKKKT